MPLFSNKKEEVIDIELTQYGKHLLSKGKFDPVYYSFHDDNIVYDLGRTSGSLSEAQNSTKSRIQSETPYLKTQHNFTNRDGNFFIVDDEDEAVRIGILGTLTTKPNLPGSTITDFTRVIPTREENYVLLDPIGTSDINTEKSPAWQISMLHAEINSSTNYLEDSTKHQIVRVPQLETDITYKTTIAYASGNPGFPMGFKEDPELSRVSSTSGAVYADNTYIAIEPDYMLMDVLEKNSAYTKENFEIEVYEITGSELIPLTFGKKKDLTVSDVGYYFDILVDDEIREDLLCENLTKLKSKDIHLDLDLECDFDKPISLNPYATDAPDLEDC